MSKKMTILCDNCNQEIALNDIYVNADTYGKEFCLYCISNMTAAELLVKLNLDDIKVMIYAQWDNVIKATDYFKNRGIS